jgi:hypothetical protein
MAKLLERLLATAFSGFEIRHPSEIRNEQQSKGVAKTL